MVSILQKSSTDSPKLASLRKRPELPQRLARDVILKDKIDYGNKDQVPSTKNSIHSTILMPLNGKEAYISKKQLSTKEMLKPLSIGKKITLKSFELTSCRPVRPQHRLFRNQTISGAMTTKSQELSKEIKTCKVQPICVSRDRVGSENVRILTKSFSIDASEAERNPTENRSIPLKRSKLLRSESDAGARLKYFSLRRPKTIEAINSGEGLGKRWNSQLRNSGSYLEDGDGDEHEIRKGSKVKTAFNESCRNFLSQAEHSRAKKPASLPRQNSLDLLSPEDALDKSDSDYAIRNEKVFHRSQIVGCSSIVQLTKLILNNSNNYNINLQPVTSTNQSSFRAFSDTNPEPQSSHKSNKTSPKSSIISKVSKKKSSTKVTSSFVRNVPSLLSGLTKSLPLQSSCSTNEIQPTTSTTLTATADKELTKKLRMSPVRMFQGKNRLKPGKFPPQDERHSTQPSPSSSAPSSSSPSSSTGNHVHEVSTDSDPKTKQQKQPGRPSIAPSLETCLSNVSQFSTFSEDVDKRDLILKEFLISEKQYVETLRMLVEKYMLPLKTQDIVDSSFVEEIFYKVQEIYVHHATLITFLAKALSHWSDGSTVGDVIYKHFSKETVVESYTSFIEHFPRAERALQESLSKSSFQKFIEQCEKETKMKLPLMAQLVKPVQRIPRYELLLKRLLENTSLTHPDYPLLKQAEEAIHDLALKINEVNSDDTSDEGQVATLKKLELLLITDLVSPGRFYVRNDLVSVREMKDQTCCLWFFSDLLIFSFVKRKNVASNRKTTLLLRSANGNDYVDNVKHKVWLKISLNQVKMTHSTITDDLNEKTTAKVELEKDHETLNEIVHLTNRLKCSHFSMDEAVETVGMEIGRKLKEIDNTCWSHDKMHYLLLQTHAQDCPQHLHLTFSSAEKQMHWELTFLCYKKKSENT